VVKWWSLSLSAGILCSCASVKKVDLGSHTNPSYELTRLADEFAAGLEAQYDVLDPDDFSRAQSEWSRARDLVHRKPAVAMEALSYSQAYLNRAKDRAMQLQAWTQDILEARAKALRAGVRTWPEEAAGLRRQDVEFFDQVSFLDERKSPGQAREVLQKGYLNLELRGIQASKLREIETSIHAAREADALSLAPATLKQAEEDLRVARTIIAADRYNDLLSRPAVANAKASASYLNQVMAAIQQPDGVIHEEAAQALVKQAQKLRSLKSKFATEQKVLNPR
jgi:hypothetical protein